MEFLLGKPAADLIKEKVKNEVLSLPRKPKLVILLNNEDDSSKGYVRSLLKVGLSLEIDVQVIEMDHNENNYVNKIIECNNDKSIDSILVTRPLAKGIDENKILSLIAPYKDVDALNPLCLGKLLSGDESLTPNTALAIIKLAEYYNIPLKGKKVLVVGRSLSVGKPAALLFLNRHATVTIAHSRTENLDLLLKDYDIVVGAVGKPHLLKGNLMKKGAIALDAGIHYLEDKIIGDIQPSDNLSYISKVPGGVGTLTTACLFENVLACYKENNHD